MKSASIFLNGSYPAEHLEFYRDAITQARGKRFLIAADGGLLLFRELGLKPDLVIGDFDSVDAAVLAEFADVETIRFPNEKDATDGELAIREAIARDCDDIAIYGAIDMMYETDHLLANLFLLKLARRLLSGKVDARSVRVIDHLQNIYLVEDESLALSGRAGNFVSVIPVCEECEVSISGAAWELDKQRIAMGSSRTLRNRFAGTNVEIAVSGTALVVHRNS